MRSLEKALTAAFLIAFIDVVIGAVVTAMPLTSGWYDAESSYWTYGTTLVASSVLLVVVLGGAASRRQHLERELRTVQDAIVEPRKIRQVEKRIETLKAGSGHVFRLVAGPLAVALVILAISAAMLPGSGGFAQSNHRLNTAFVLIVAYGSAVLGSYVAAVQLALLRAGRVEWQ